MREVRRDGDGELCGFVDRHDDRWYACVVFGSVLGVHDTERAAVDQVLADGLAALTGLWTLRDVDGREEHVRIVEAAPDRVTVARGYYVLADVPRLSITGPELRAGTWSLHR